MAAALPRATFSGSGLVRRLSELAGAGATQRDTADDSGPQQTFAERLGLWLDWTDAIALSAALNAVPAPRPAGPAGPDADADATAEGQALRQQNAAVAACARVRKDLVKLATSDRVFAADKTAATSEASDFSAYRRDYLGHQRAMDISLGPLRAHVRAALASVSAELARLAALDAVLDDALRPRERHLLATVPHWLEKHFEHLQQTHPADEVKLSRYQQDMRNVLSAELEMRWQPIEGMMDALRHEASRQP